MRPIFPLLLTALLTSLCLTPLSAQEVKRTYAVRLQGKVVGHMTETEEPATDDGRPVVRYRTRTVVKVELLGASIDQDFEQTWLLEPDTRRPLRLDARTDMGSSPTTLSGRATDAGFELDNGTPPLDLEKVVAAPDLRWLQGRAPAAGKTLETDWFVPELASVQPLRVTRAEPHEREIDVLGATTKVLVYRLAMPAVGTDAVAFVRADDYEVVRYELPAQDMVMDLVPASVVERIERVDLTDSILVRTDFEVEDAAVLTSLKLRADIQATDVVTAASLSVPGQRFEGTVDKGRIQGVFTIRPPRVDDDTDGPPFPVPDGEFGAAELQPYQVSEENIESDDPGIVAKAKELAEGATTCLEVVERLGRWAYDEIPYEIPGGGSAKRTFETRRGECGGHSRVLAAMLRSLGIPARTPMGGMYVPLYGGAFAQHMWTEVWLGEQIGWLPVDCTAGQFTFVDAGHIRLSETITSFRPKEIVVLDHEPKAATERAPASERRSDPYPYEVGETLTYAWTIGGKALGTEQITYRGMSDGAHVFEGKVDLGGRFVETTRTAVGDDGRLIAFHAERKVGDVEETLDVALADGEARFTRKSTEGDREHAEKVDPSVFVLHNNNTLHFALAVDRIGALVEGAEHRVRLLHTEQRTVFPMVLKVGGRERITIGEGDADARVVDADLVGLAIRVHVDDRGRVLRFLQQQQDVRIELQR